MALIVRSIAGALLSGALSLAATAPVWAECVQQPNRWPAFTEVAPTAQRILIGTVTEGIDQFDPGQYHVAFRLRVDDVLRGDAPKVIEIVGLRSGVPLTGSDGCQATTYLAAKDGDIIAIAYGGLATGVGHRVTTAAWIHGRPSIHTQGAQHLTLADVRRIAALPNTSTDTIGAATRADQSQWLELLAVFVAAAAAARVAGFHRRPAGQRD